MRSRGGLAPNIPWAIKLSASCCIGSTVDLGRDYIEAGNQRYQVGDHQPAAELVNHTHRGKRPGADMHAPRIGAAVADRVPAHVAARALDSNLALSRLGLEIARHFGKYRTVGDPVERLTQDFRGLPHLAYSHHVAVHRVAERAELTGAHRDIEIKFRINRIGNILADIPFESRAAQIGTNQVVIDSVLGANHANVGQTFDVYFVVRNEGVVFFPNRIEMVEIGQRLLAPSRRQVPSNAADPHIVEGKPRATQLLDQIVDHLAFADRMGKRRHRAYI